MKMVLQKVITFIFYKREKKLPAVQIQVTSYTA